MDAVRPLGELSDTELVSSLKALVDQDNNLEVQILAHLAEVETRELHIRGAYKSMHAYCTIKLGFDDGAAFNRITVARLGRRFPRVLEMVGSGELTLSSARVLAPHLQPHNSVELLAAAAGKSKREVEKLLATRAPRPDVPASVRKLPTRSEPRPAQQTELAPNRSSVPANGEEPAKPSPEPPARPTPSAQSDPAEPTPLAPRAPKRRDPVPEPLSAARYKITFTASAALVERLERVEGLLAHRSSGCGTEQAIEEALELLEKKLIKKRFGGGAKARKQRRAGKRKRSRHIPMEIKRAVLERDGLRCAYVDPESGRRCTETKHLELQHHKPFARGGEHSVDNISLYCKTHNQYAARRDYGPAHIAAAIASSAAVTPAGTNRQAPAAVPVDGQLDPLVETSAFGGAHLDSPRDESSRASTPQPHDPVGSRVGQHLEAGDVVHRQ